MGAESQAQNDSVDTEVGRDKPRDTKRQSEHQEPMAYILPGRPKQVSLRAGGSCPHQEK
jgi:hypothetical protein